MRELDLEFHAAIPLFQVLLWYLNWCIFISWHQLKSWQCCAVEQHFPAWFRSHVSLLSPGSPQISQCCQSLAFQKHVRTCTALIAVFLCTSAFSQLLAGTYIQACSRKHCFQFCSINRHLKKEPRISLLLLSMKRARLTKNLLPTQLLLNYSQVYWKYSPLQNIYNCSK